jgi:hypothetical protein
MALKETVPAGENGLVELRSMGNPLCFAGISTARNFGSSNWADLFNLTGQGDRIFIGAMIYNSSATVQLLIALVNARGAEVTNFVVEASASLALDSLTFGPGFAEKFALAGQPVLYVRAKSASTSGTAASGTATYSTNLPNNSFATVGTKKYLLLTTPSGAPVANTIQVQIGATLAATLTNLSAAIAANDPLVVSSATGTVLTVTSTYTGTGMNSFVFVDGSTPTGGTFTGSGTLGGSGAAAVGAAGIVVDATVW